MKYIIPTSPRSIYNPNMSAMAENPRAKIPPDDIIVLCAATPLEVAAAADPVADEDEFCTLLVPVPLGHPLWQPLLQWSDVFPQ